MDDSFEDKAVLVDCEENVYETAVDGIVPDKPRKQISVQAHEKSGQSINCTSPPYHRFVA